MSIKLFKQDKNYILKKVQSKTKNHLLKNLIKKSIIKYELESNPLGLIDSTSISLKKYEINHESKLNFFYKKISTIYRYNYGEVQLSFLWDGSSHHEFYKNRWVSFFENETNKMLENYSFLKYILSITVFSKNINDISENQYKLSTYIRKEFKIQVFKKKGVVLR
ncbi:MAG: hypothetical protein P8L24_05555 [Cytophagales bacterium]|nr:hypothetical protein [Cytophagales bacterium]